MIPGTGGRASALTTILAFRTGVGNALSRLARASFRPERWTRAASDSGSRRGASRLVGKKGPLPLATVALIAGLSLLGIGGFAVLSSASGNPPPQNAAASKTAATTPAPSIATGAPPVEPKAKSHEAPLASPALPDPRPVAVERINTASISPALPVATKTMVAALSPPPAAAAFVPIAKAPESITSATPEPRAPVPSPKARHVSAAEATAYLARAEAALRNGDVVGARSLFGLLASADDPRGALGMARTYDESEFRKLPVYGLKPDRAEAERWRARARELTIAATRTEGGR